MKLCGGSDPYRSLWENQGGPAVWGGWIRAPQYSQFGSVATQSVEKPCILLGSHLRRGRGAAELQLMMGKEAGTKGKSVCVSSSFPEASTIQDLTLEGESRVCQSL